MSPEQLRQFEEMKAELVELRQFKANMENYASMPRDIPEIIGRRLNITQFGQISTATKSASSEDQAVNEAGTGTYNVLKSPDGFLLVRDGAGNALGFVPYFS